MAAEEAVNTLPVKLEPIVQQIQEFLPTASTGRDRAVAAMKAITEITSDEDREKVNGLLVKVRATHEKISGLRMPTTSELDNIKKYLMTFEKDLAQDNKDNEVYRLRSLIGSYDQKKLDEKKRIEEEAAAKKIRENYKVDLVTAMRKNLSDMIIQRIQQVEDGSRDYFNATTLEDFDKRMTQFKKFKPVLKEEMWKDCFQVKYDIKFITIVEWSDLLNGMMKEEPYEKWNDIVVKEVIPRMNDWLGRIPELKEKLEAKEKAKGDAAKTAALEAENKKKEDEEQKIRQAEIDKKKKESEDQIAQTASINKVQNDFIEQAVTQQVEDTGPVKVLLKFKDEKPLKTITEMLYHCFTNPKFPDIRKKNKDGSYKVDEHGFPEYVDWVDYIVAFYAKHGDLKIGGIETKEIPKVIVRK